MAKQGRFFRPKPKALQGTPYDSMLEKRLHEDDLEGVEFHTRKIPYHIEHTYHPDFIHTTDEATFLIEAKGYFQDSAEMQKYKWVAKSLDEGTYLVFVFEKPHKPIHFQKKRKDGTKMTHAEWAEKNGFMWFSEETVHRLLK